MRILMICFSLWLATFSVVAQEIPKAERIVENGKSFYLHTVKAGETLYSISRRYQVSLEDVTTTNPSVSRGIKAGDILKIPAAEETPKEADQGIVRIILHKVERKETLYSVSRKFGISIDDILSFNPGLTQLKRGETIRIPQWGTGSTSGESLSSSGTARVHWVQSGETFYAISRRYGVTVPALMDENPGIKDLQPGMRLSIPAQGGADHTGGVVEETFSHTIQPGETLYSLSKKYGVSADRLVELNPALDRSFRSGTRIRIPRIEVPAPIPPEQGGVVRHVVVSGETLYSIAGKYEVTMDELVTANPELKSRSPWPGDTLVVLIPEIKAGIAEVADESDEKEHPEFGNKAGKPGEVTIAMLLPLMIDANRHLNSGFLSGKSGEGDDGYDNPRSVVSSSGEKYITFQGNSENFLHFYEGALLAVDSLRLSGINARLKVFDTEQRASKIRSLMNSGELEQADVIIGPVFPEEQKEISKFAKERGIPVVSPLSSSDEITVHNPWFFQVNPPREYVVKKTMEYLAADYHNSNFIILQTGQSAVSAQKEAGLLRQELIRSGDETGEEKVRVIDYQKDGYSALKNSLVTTRKNVIVILSDNEAEVSVAVSNVKTLTSGFDITLIGTNKFPQFESINSENFHAGNLEFLTPYWPDYGQKVTRSFVSKFRHYYKSDPNQFSMQGYDVVFFFARAFNDFRSDFMRMAPQASAALLQGNYRFEPLESGGFVNDGLIVIRYTPDFQIVRKK